MDLYPSGALRQLREEFPQYLICEFNGGCSDGPELCTAVLARADHPGLSSFISRPTVAELAEALHGIRDEENPTH